MPPRSSPSAGEKVVPARRPPGDPVRPSAGPRPERLAAPLSPQCQGRRDGNVEGGRRPGPGQAAGGGGERAWPGSLRAVRRLPAIVRRRRRGGRARGGAGAGAEVGRRAGVEGAAGVGAGSRAPAGAKPLPGVRSAQRVWRGRPLRGLGRDVSRTVVWGRCACPPPTKDRSLGGRETRKTESPPPAERRTSAREAFPGEGGGRMRGSHRLRGGQGSADTSASRRARQPSPGPGG